MEDELQIKTQAEGSHRGGGVGVQGVHSDGGLRDAERGAADGAAPGGPGRQAHLADAPLGAALLAPASRSARCAPQTSSAAGSRDGQHPVAASQERCIGRPLGYLQGTLFKFLKNQHAAAS